MRLAFDKGGNPVAGFKKLRSIINQNEVPLLLPDLRNLGTILRILLAVNAFVLIAASVREPRWETLSATWVEMVALVEPPLLLELLILYILAPWFGRLAYESGAVMVIALTLAVSLGFNAAVSAWIADMNAATMLRHVLYSLAIAGVLLYYFQLRAKALSPAITGARLQALQARIRPHFLFNSMNAVLSL